MRNILVLLNARAGALIDAGAAALQEALQAELSARGAQVSVRTLSPRRMIAAIAQAASSAHDTIVIGGGDGSVNAAVNVLAGTGKTLGVLPCGTMNLFARDLGMPADLRAAVGALARAEPRKVDLASLNGRLFHSISGLGFFSQMARAREEARDLPGKLLRLGAAALRAFMRSGRFSLRVEIDGKARDVESYAVLVTCNRFEGNEWRRAALDAGCLEVHIAEDEGAMARMKAAADLMSGEWRDNPGILSVAAHRVVISGRRKVFVTTDGELRRQKTPLNYGIRPRALAVLVPA